MTVWEVSNDIVYISLTQSDRTYEVQKTCPSLTVMKLNNFNK